MCWRLTLDVWWLTLDVLNVLNHIINVTIRNLCSIMNIYDSLGWKRLKDSCQSESMKVCVELCVVPINQSNITLSRYIIRKDVSQLSSRSSDFYATAQSLIIWWHDGKGIWCKIWCKIGWSNKCEFYPLRILHVQYIRDTKHIPIREMLSNVMDNLY